MTPTRSAIALCLVFAACSDERSAVDPSGPAGSDTTSTTTAGSSTDPSADTSEDETTSSPSETSTDGSTSVAASTDPTTDAESSSDAESSTGDEVPYEVVACPAIVAESAYCLMLDVDGERMVAVGADTGFACWLAPAPAIRGLPPTSLAWVDDDAIFCPMDSSVVTRMRLAVGTVEPSTQPCSAVTDIDDVLFVAPSWRDPSSTEPYRLFDSFEDIVDGNPPTLLDIQPFASVFAGANDTLYAAWHAADHLQRFDPSDSSQQPDLPLENYDGPVEGLSVVGSRVFVFDGGILREFDAVTGMHVADVPVGLLFASGLACRPGV